MYTDQISIDKIFHDPSANNNYAVYLRKAISPERYNHALRLMYVGLNQADLLLKNWLTNFNSVEHFSPSVDGHLKDWSAKLDCKLNLAGVFYVKEIFASYHKMGYDIPAILARNGQHIIENFTRQPMELLDVWRINICIPYDSLSTVFDLLVAHLSLNQEACSAIDRVELLLNRPREEVVEYPTMILYLNPNALQQERLTLALLRCMNTFLESIDCGRDISNHFADPWLRHANITQGFKLYKVYLSLLGVLKSVYDSRTNYAYVLGDAEQTNNAAGLGVKPIRNILNEIL